MRRSNFVFFRGGRATRKDLHPLAPCSHVTVFVRSCLPLKQVVQVTWEWREGLLPDSHITRQGCPFAFTTEHYDVLKCTRIMEIVPFRTKPFHPIQIFSLQSSRLMLTLCVGLSPPLMPRAERQSPPSYQTNEYRIVVTSYCLKRPLTQKNGRRPGYANGAKEGVLHNVSSWLTAG